MSFKAMLRQSITIYGRPGHTADGRETVGSSTTLRARFEHKTENRLLPNGEAVRVDGMVFVPASTTVSVDDKITFDSVDYKVVFKHSAVTGRGKIHHIELEVQKWQN